MPHSLSRGVSTILTQEPFPPEVTRCVLGHSAGGGEECKTPRAGKDLLAVKLAIE